MNLDYEYGVLFRAPTGDVELFDCPLSLRSARRVARLLARRWNAEVELVPCARDGSPAAAPAERLGPLLFVGEP